MVDLSVDWKVLHQMDHLAMDRKDLGQREKDRKDLVLMETVQKDLDQKD